MKMFNLIITTKKKQDDLISSRVWRIEKINNALSISSTINPVLLSLKELRENTWDKQRIVFIPKNYKSQFDGMNQCREYIKSVVNKGNNNL